MRMLRCSSTLALLVVIVGFAATGRTGAAGNASAATNIDHSQFQDRVRETRYVAVRDGTRLAVSIYRPATDGVAAPGKFPVVFGFTPYRHRYRDEQGNLIEAIDNPSFATRSLARHGYVIVFADIRGKGASFGHRRGFQDRTEALDGRDLIAWIAAQPWSNGKVGMSGCSYNGGTTVHVATTRPPALKAIFTGASDLDKYAFVRRGGIPAQFNTRPDEPPEVDLASEPVDADRNGSLLRAAVAEHAANSSMAALWYGMPYRDSVSPLTGNAFWEEVGPYTYLKDLQGSGIKTYFWGNWHDEPTEQVMRFAAATGGRLLIGPGSHCVPPPGYDLDAEVRRYFNWALKGIDGGFSSRPRVTWWFDDGRGAGRWLRTAATPGVNSGRGSLFLAVAGVGAGELLKLASSPASRQTARSFTIDYGVASADYFSFWIDPMEGQGLVWSGAALDHAQALIGFPIVHLTVAADRRDANIFAYLEEVDLQGKANVVSFGRLAASHRKLAKAPYPNFGLPWSSGLRGDARPLSPHVPVSLSFALTPTARTIPAGHRLRLRVTGADPRQRNLADLREDPAPQIIVFSGGANASRVDLPYAPIP